MKTPNEPKQVVELVQTSLKKHQPRGFHIQVVADGVRREDGWWYVPVRPSKMIQRSTPYYDALADVEGNLQDSMDLNILLVPTARDA
jgi:hypothetical protein